MWTIFVIFVIWILLHKRTPEHKHHTPLSPNDIADANYAKYYMKDDLY